MGNFVVDLPFEVSVDLVRNSEKKATGVKIGIVGGGLNLQSIKVDELPAQYIIVKAMQRLNAEGNLAKAHELLPDIIKELMK